MPFHLFGPPPHLHLLPVVLTAGLAFAAGAYYVARNGVPAYVSRLGSNLRQRADDWRSKRGEGCSSRRASFRHHGETGNQAFDAYRGETVARIEKEAAEFRAYIDGLRGTADREEFDRFMAERRNRSAGGSAVSKTTSK